MEKSRAMREASGAWGRARQGARWSRFGRGFAPRSRRPHRRRGEMAWRSKGLDGAHGVLQGGAACRLGVPSAALEKSAGARENGPEIRGHGRKFAGTSVAPPKKCLECSRGRRKRPGNSRACGTWPGAVHGRKVRRRRARPGFLVRRPRAKPGLLGTRSVTRGSSGVRRATHATSIGWTPTNVGRRSRRSAGSSRESCSPSWWGLARRSSRLAALGLRAGNARHDAGARPRLLGEFGGRGERRHRSSPGWPGRPRSEGPAVVPDGCCPLRA